VIRCGIPSYKESSILLGSIISSFTSSGVDLYSILQIMAFNPTLLPVPVAPATRKCGILSNSATTGLPMISLPRHRARFDLDFSKTPETTSSLNFTTCLSVFGISIPITALPGTGATIRILAARRVRARSSVRLTILLILTPGAGSYSKVVMTGPGDTSTTFPLTPKSSSFFSSSFDCILKFSSSTEDGFP